MMKIFGQLWAPVFDNPVLCWMIDQYVDWSLRWYYYPIQAAMDLQELRAMFQGSNICQPQSAQHRDVEPANVELPTTQA